MLRRVAAFCRPLRPVLLLVSFPRSRSPVVDVLGLCWMWRDVPFACQRRPIIGVLRMCWLLWGSFDCFSCPHTSVHRPSIACLAVFLCGPGALFPHALSGPSTICPFPAHGWSAPDGLPLLLRKQPIWAAGDTPPPVQGTQLTAARTTQNGVKRSPDASTHIHSAVGYKTDTTQLITSDGTATQAHQTHPSPPASTSGVTSH